MTTLGTPNSNTATRLMLLGSGELGKEIAIEAQRLGIEVIAVDRYPNAPAMQVAHRHYVASMVDATALQKIIAQEKPHYIVPEIEAIATSMLVDLETEGYRIIPTANAVHLTMNREGIRRLAAETLGLPTSPYQFADSFDLFLQAVKTVGLPCVVKPVMSSSGKGQSIVKRPDDINKAWETARTAGRTNSNNVIVEGFIPFDYEITLLTIRHIGGTSFCSPIGHRQVNGDYHESWQPHPMPATLLKQAEQVAKAITDALGGYGLFGVEFFIRNDQVYFSEVSPRPHDTGLVTLASQNLSEFALHVRAILGLPIPSINQLGPTASAVILGHGHGNNIQFSNLDKALAQPDTYLRLFGKPDIDGERRLGVAFAMADTVEAARQKARQAAQLVSVEIAT